MKLKIIAVVAAILVVGGAGIYFSTRASTKNVSPQSASVAQATVEATPTQPTAQKISGSMRDLVVRRESLRCVFNQQTEFAKTVGYVYTAEGKMRGDLTITPSVAQAKQFTASMIVDGDSSYVWSSVMKEGFKVPVKTEVQPKAKGVSDGVDYNQQLDFTCEKWDKDVTAFVPPATVTFVAKPN